MPAFCTHYFFSEDMRQDIKELSNTDININAINVGTQGPDIFFFHKLLSIKNSKRGVGIALHNTKAEKIFDAFAEYLRSNNNSIARSYAYGFVLHYSLDRIVHPYVFAKEKEITDVRPHIHHSSAHNEVEIAMDAYILNKRTGITNPKEYCSAAAFNLTQEEKTEIGKILSFVVSKATDCEATVEQIVEAIDDSRWFQNASRDASGLLIPLFLTGEAITGPLVGYYKFSSMVRKKDWKYSEKYVNADNQKWYSPYDKDTERRESFLDLFEKAKEDARGLLFGLDQIIAGTANGYEITHNISFLTGQEVFE